MAKFWNNQRYNTDWEPIDDMGNVTGAKDWDASNANPEGPSAPVSSPWAQPAPAAQPSKFHGAVTDKLLAELGTPTTVDKSDPAYQQSVEAFRFNADRSADRQRAATAQRMHAQGTLSGGGLDTAVTRILDDQGGKETAFEADLMRSMRDQNIQRMSRALQLGTGLMSQEQEQALRAALAREGYALQKELAANDLDFRRDQLGVSLGLGEAQLNQQALLAMLGA